MIKIPKILSPSYRPFTHRVRLVVEGIILLLFLIFIPSIARGTLRLLSLKAIVLFYALACAFSFLLLHVFLRKKNLASHALQDLHEKINVANDEFLQAKKNYSAIEEKIARYNNLKIIIEELHKQLSLEQIARSLCAISFSLIAKEKGNCLLYLIDTRTHSLALFKTQKQDSNVVIKAKQGDIFDSWVTRHASPLIIEDARKDFRFDIEKLSFDDQRQVHSLIASPLVNEHRYLGLLRLDSPEASAYSQDDLRLLVTLCDFGAVAIENSELFQKTQDLAIHDGLTQVFTKGYFMERLHEECKRGIRSNASLSLLMLDIDFFKHYNDTFGHTAGDIVLKNLCGIMQESLKDLAPLIGRFGGEEFCVLLPGVDKAKAYEAAELLRASVEGSRITLRRQATKVTVSIGVANFPQDTIAPEEFVFKADQALYRAKNQGRNRVIAA